MQMVYNLGASYPSPSKYWKAWMRTACRYLACAQYSLDRYHECSDYLSKHAVECALKAVLEKNNVLTEDLKKGSKGHNIELLIQRIIENKCLPSNFFNRERREAIRKTTHQNTSYSDDQGGVRIINIDWRDISQSRYPREGHSQDELISPKKAKEVVDNCEKAVNEIKIALEYEQY